jgi:hypothetical protein
MCGIEDSPVVSDVDQRTGRICRCANVDNAAMVNKNGLVSPVLTTTLA